MADCKNIVVSAVKKVLIAPLGADKTSAKDLGFTGETVTFTSAQSFTEVRVDQRLGIVRRVPTEATYTLAIPLNEITIDNLAYGLGVDFDASGNASIAQERYFQLWIETDGPVSNETDGTKYSRTIYIPKLSVGGTAEIGFSRTDKQTDNLECTIVNCNDNNIFQIIDEEESAS